MTQDQARAIKMIADAIVDAVRASGQDGAPGGILYAAMMGAGCTLEQFEALMGALVAAGRLTRRGQLYFVKGDVA